MVLRRAAGAPATQPAARRLEALAGPEAAARQLQRLVGLLPRAHYEAALVRVAANVSRAGATCPGKLRAKNASRYAAERDSNETRVPAGVAAKS
jgi:hypothetical protein